ncbi:DinB family protein [Bacillus sp. AK031]
MKAVDTLRSLQSYTDYLIGLKSINTELANAPITEGKWSIKEIISHIYRWDIYLLEVALPSAIQSKSVNFPSHDEYNEASVLYSETVGFNELIDHSVQIRNNLINEINNCKVKLEEPITVQGNTHCPNTNAVYTFLYLLGEFVEHDRHHFNQINTYLSPEGAKPI